MANEIVKDTENKAFQGSTGGQKFLLGMLCALVVVIFAGLFVKFSHMDFSKIVPEHNQITAEKNADNLSDKELYRTNLENQTAKKVKDVLSKIVGKDNVSVQVNAEIDFNSTKSTVEKYRPVSASLTEKEIRQIVSEPGAIKRITIAVAVNKILTTKEKQELKELVASAGGVDFARGDAVSVSDLRFLALPEVKAEQTALAQKAQLAIIFKVLVNDILPLGVVLLLGILAIRAIKLIFGKMTVQNDYRPQSVKTSIDYDAYEPFNSISYEKSEINQEQENFDENQDYKPEIGQLKEELSKTILSNTADAVKLLTSYIKD